MDRHNVLRSGRSFFLGLDLLRSSHSRAYIFLYLFEPQINNMTNNALFTDRVVFHDKPVSRRDRDSILRDEEARDGTNETRTR